ncbi:hypothetical protein H2201_003441 [Coniosporium apollinis]|uniref:F-box domain-containing protein n=1 Tax=Coniosporium apollinis TaxID=61459 RepID=A0ABQ9P0X0_9PEZI|nr:hypothetical protein H2201_003441 [Coniosporium apollinis]
MDSTPPTSECSSGDSTPVAFDNFSTLDKAASTGVEKDMAELVLESEPASPTASHSQLADEAPEVPTSKDKVLRRLKGKEKVSKPLVAEEGVSPFLNLPVDILKEIINQLPHTNDLTSLALCHSALHRLTIPYIYSRFDIVWPDATATAEPRTGVDALTYGLATLVMANELFGEEPYYTPSASRSGASSSAFRSLSQVAAAGNPFPLTKRRRGNHYANYTKKFSLGNGPPDWVQEYLITKEGGKMLGTLVALALSRMRSLETFVWDMPTGILRDVWLALSSLADRDDGLDCRLQRVWVRWHDNSQMDSSPLPPPPALNGMPPPPPIAGQTSGINNPHTAVAVAPHHYAPVPAIERVEHPSFSVLPALKSLSVLDIDELPYLDEMSILIGRSQKCLRELRVGIARHAQQRDWVTVWEGEGVQQVDYSTNWTAQSSIGEKRLGGVLGVLVGRVYNVRQNKRVEEEKASAHRTPDRAHSGKQPVVSPSVATEDREPELELTPSGEVPTQDASPTEQDAEVAILQPHPEQLPEQTPEKDQEQQVTVEEDSGTPTPTASPKRPKADIIRDGPLLDGQLKLHTLELERVPLSVNVLRRAFDWSALTSLTLLHCNNHEQLWKSLRRTYSPRLPQSASAPGIPYPSSSRRHSISHLSRSDYALNLKKIHTNTVSPSLVSFLKETLAPNSLEVLFLQEGRSYSSSVTVDAIYRGPLRRHRGSLKKLMIDSSERDSHGHATTSAKWRRWVLNREILSFITSGKMTSLRELAVSIDYRDWHLFLQRLPNIPTVRSLYIPHVADHAHGNNIDPKELAHQIEDIVTLRPEIEICYMGIVNKCFEILESKNDSHQTHTGSLDGGPFSMPTGYQNVDGMSEDDEDDEDDEDEDDIDGTGMGAAGEGEETESEGSDADHNDSDDEGSYTHEDDRKEPRLKLREILFYDDKVQIFRARHGKL